MQAADQKRKNESKNKARREASRAKFAKTANRRRNSPRARLGFVKPIRNRLRKIKNLIENRRYRVDTGLAGR